MVLDEIPDQSLIIPNWNWFVRWWHSVPLSSTMPLALPCFLSDPVSDSSQWILSVHSFLDTAHCSNQLAIFRHSNVTIPEPFFSRAIHFPFRWTYNSWNAIWILNPIIVIPVSKCISVSVLFLEIYTSSLDYTGIVVSSKWHRLLSFPQPCAECCQWRMPVFYIGFYVIIVTKI